MARRARDPRPAGAAGTVAEQLAEGLAGTGGPLRQHVAEGLRDLGAVDLAVYSAVAAAPTPSLDEPLRRLSNAANNSGLWFAIAAALALAGGGAGRRAALRGTLAIGATSALVNLAVKSIWARQRPDRVATPTPQGTLHEMNIDVVEPVHELVDQRRPSKAPEASLTDVAHDDQRRMLVSYDLVVAERIHQGLSDQIVPSVLKYFDLPDVIASLAPRRVAVFNGVNQLGQELAADRLHSEYARAGESYAKAGAAAVPEGLFSNCFRIASIRCCASGVCAARICRRARICAPTGMCPNGYARCWKAHHARSSGASRSVVSACAALTTNTAAHSGAWTIPAAFSTTRRKSTARHSVSTR